MAGLINKVKETLTGHHSDTSPTGHHSDTSTTSPTGHHTTSGPHGSDMANKMDPRVDSNNDDRTGLTGGTGTTGSSGLTGSSPHDGPHRSNLANKMDPYVDSDHDGKTALTGNTGTTGTSGTSGLTGSGYSGNDGPHRSNVLNKMDPRVDSDHDGSRGVTGTTGTTGTSGLTGTGHHGSGLTGSSNVDDVSRLPAGIDPQGLLHGHHTTLTGEKLDPHVSGTSHSPTMGGTGLTGSRDTTSGAGPHKSSLLNKLDPRVDSDGDGSNRH